MSRFIIALGGFFGAAGVAAGAIGSHLLKGQVDDALYAIFSQATLYLLVHAIALLVSGVSLSIFGNNKWFQFASILFIVGIVLFCGGLMLRVVTEDPSVSRFAPVGGSALILAWLCLIGAGFTHRVGAKNGDV